MISARIFVMAVALPALLMHACQAPRDPGSVTLTYEYREEGGPHFKVHYFQNGTYALYEGLSNCGIPGVQPLQIPKGKIDELIHELARADFSRIPRIPKRSSDPYGVTITCRDDFRIHEVVDYHHEDPRLVRLEKQLRDVPDIDKLVEPSVDMYRRLVSSGWDVNTTGEDRENALTSAVNRQNLESVQFLLQSGATVSGSALESAAWGKRTDLLRLLLDHSRIDLKGRQGALLLWNAARGRGSSESTRLLIEVGVNVNAREPEGQRTALQAALLSENTDAARLLIEAGVDVNSTESERRRTPLMAAVEGGCLPVMALLIGRGADVHARDTAGRTALWRAGTASNSGFGTLLSRRGADVNAADNYGRTALMNAADCCATWNIEALLAAGADPMLADKSGVTALKHIGQTSPRLPRCSTAQKMVEAALLKLEVQQKTKSR